MNSSDAIVLTDGKGRILDVNAPWEYLCGYSLEEVQGKTSACLQGASTCPSAIAEISRKCRSHRAVRRSVVNYKKGNVGFVNNVMILPLYDPTVVDGPAFVARLTDANALGLGDGLEA